MKRLSRLLAWFGENRDGWLELVRIFLGVALLLKGIAFVRDGASLGADLEKARLGFGSALLAHYVVLGHLGGGLLLILGLLTRLAALIQVPILAGAVFLVHAQEGLFAPTMQLELAVMVLFLLVLFSVAGGGCLSADHYLRRDEARGLAPVIKLRS